MARARSSSSELAVVPTGPPTGPLGSAGAAEEGSWPIEAAMARARSSSSELGPAEGAWLLLMLPRLMAAARGWAGASWAGVSWPSDAAMAAASSSLSDRAARGVPPAELTASSPVTATPPSGVDGRSEAPPGPPPGASAGEAPVNPVELEALKSSGWRTASREAPAMSRLTQRHQSFQRMIPAPAVSSRAVSADTAEGSDATESGNRPGGDDAPPAPAAAEGGGSGSGVCARVVSKSWRRSLGTKPFSSGSHCLKARAAAASRTSPLDSCTGRRSQPKSTVK
mmetsp:Transcript_6547/g.15030  ORF Transcript_6547/g.15030 Transcript_6547/m.15030 type:complete len:282 (-) Transcript_6547:83-928(-)